MNVRHRLVGLALAFSLLLSVAAAPASASPRQLNGSWLCTFLSYFRTQQMAFNRPASSYLSSNFFDDLWYQYCGLRST